MPHLQSLRQRCIEKQSHVISLFLQNNRTQTVIQNMGRRAMKEKKAKKKQADLGGDNATRGGSSGLSSVKPPLPGTTKLRKMLKVSQVNTG